MPDTTYPSSLSARRSFLIPDPSSLAPVLLLLVIGHWSLVIGTPAFAQGSPRGLLDRAAQLARLGDLTAAIDAARAALRADPNLADGHELLGRCHEARADEAREDRELAIQAYGRALLLDENVRRGGCREALAGLFYNRPPPRWLDASVLAVMPGAFAQEVVPNRDPRLAGVEDVLVCQSTEMLYPPQVPMEHPRYGARFNRTAYGYVMGDSGPEPRMWLRAVLYYPSTTLAARKMDYSPDARAALSLILRLFCYHRAYLASAHGPIGGGPLTIWMVEGGEVEAEQQHAEMALFGIEKSKTPLEQIRQVCHEFGHYALPPFGPYTAPEPWANGPLGERLYALWLARNGADGCVPWAGQPVSLQSYLQEDASSLVECFFVHRPESDALLDRGPAGMSHLIGFLLYAQQILPAQAFAAALFSQAHLTGAEDLMAGFKRTVSALEPPRLTLPAGLFSPVEGSAGDSGEGATAAGDAETGFSLLEAGQRTLSLAAGQEAAYWVYLPPGTWHLTLFARGPGIGPDETGFSVALQGRNPTEAQLSLPTNQTEASVSLGQSVGGWYRIAIRHENTAGSVTFAGMRLSRTDSPF